MLSLVSHDVYYWEALSFALLARSELAEFDLLHYSEPPLNLAFTRFGPQAPRRLFSHALNMGAEHTLRCHHIHQTSPEAVDAARKIGVPENRMTLLPYGIWTDRFNPDRSEGARSRTRALYGIPYDRPVLLCVAAVNSTHKRVDHLISELTQLSERPHLLLCGVLDEPELLASARRSLGEKNVTHVYVDNEKISDLYGAADLFVLPSVVEGFGLGAIEAQLSGLPVIAHHSAHFRWLLGEEAATLVDMTEPGALAKGISRYLANPSRMSETVSNARRQQVERFDWRHVLPQYIDMYSATLSHSPDLIEAVVNR